MRNQILSLSLLTIAFLIGCTQKKAETKEINLAIWGNYLSPEVQNRFEKSTGIKLHISNYSSNEELLAKVQSGASGIDVAVPSDYMVGIMAKTDLLEPLNLEQITNKSLLSENWLKPAYDPENKYSLPYAWTTAGFAINTDLYSKPLKTWKEFFTNPDLKGKISMLDDAREVIGAALKANGFSVNTTKPEELAKAKETLLAVKPRIKMFRSDTIEALVNKEVAIAHAYSVDALQAAAKNPKIIYILPEEGGTRSVDNLVIIKGAQHREAAHQLINFLLSPEANLAFVNKVRGGPVLKVTREKLGPDLKNNAALFPTEAQMKNLEKIVDVGDQTKLYDELWTAIKSQ